MAIPNGTLPRLDSSPYDDPQSFVATWDAAMDLIEANLGGGAGSEQNAPWFYKTGRAITSPLPTIPTSPALGVYLPVGFQWFQDGEMITLSAPEYVGDLPPNFDGYAVLKATRDGADWVWDIDATSTSKSALDSGSGIVGHVVTDSSGLVSIDAAAADGDVVYDMPSIAAMLGVGGSGGGGFSGVNPWLPSDTRTTEIVIDEKLGNLQNTLEDLINTSSTIKPMQNRIDILTQEHSMTRQGVIALQPDAGERSVSSNVEGTVEGTYGDGSDGRSDYVIDSTMPINDDGEFEG